MALADKMKDIDKLRKELAASEKSVAKEILNDLKKLIKDNPLIEGLRWNQYTPSFNDGDVCEFGINGPELKFDESVQPREEDHYNDNWVDAYYGVDDDFWNEKADIINHKEIKAVQKASNEACKLFSKLSEMESSLKTTFGDGVQITVTKSGVEVEDYDHD